MVASAGTALKLMSASAVMGTDMGVVAAEDDDPAAPCSRVRWRQKPFRPIALAAEKHISSYKN